MTREIPTGKPYRMSEVRVIEDIPPELIDETQRSELITRFRKVSGPGLDPDLNALFEADLPLGVLTDIVAQALGLPASIKQALLCESRVGKRAGDLLDLLRQYSESANLIEDRFVPVPTPLQPQLSETRRLDSSALNP